MHDYDSGIGINFGISPISAGIGIRDFKRYWNQNRNWNQRIWSWNRNQGLKQWQGMNKLESKSESRVLGLESELEWNQGISCWNQNQSFEFSWSRNGNRNLAVPGIMHHWFQGDLVLKHIPYRA